MKAIVTHPGTAHADDFLSCCILAEKFGQPIYRREPTARDFDEADTIVVDVGGQYNVDSYLFDHHQDQSLECALVLVLKWLGLHEKFQRAYRWYENVDFRDRNGAKKLGSKYNITEEQMLELGSPVHNAVMTQFEKMYSLWPYALPYEVSHYTEEQIKSFSLYEVMRNIGKELIEYAEKYDAAWQRLESCERQNLSGHEVVINPSDDLTATGDFARERKLSIMCSHDNRGDGWAILRCNDTPGINLSVLADHPQVVFAHKAGFIAKTKQRISVEELFVLLQSEGVVHEVR